MPPHISTALLGMLAFLFTFEGFAQDFNTQYDPYKILGTISDSRINEASGLAASHKVSGAFWLHNDSGDGPNLYMIDSTGNLLNSGYVNGASARDWEDIASFVLEGVPYLVIADVGDNPVNKSSYKLYIIEEPGLNTSQRDNNAYELISTIEFQYEDGSHDCESIGVDTLDKKIILVSKSSSGQGTRQVFELPLHLDSGPELQIANQIAEIDTEGTTAMDISTDGHHAIVLTYDNAYEFTRTAGESWSAAFSHKNRVVVMPERPGGEAIAYAPNGVDLYLVREGENSPVWLIKGKKDSGLVFQVDMYEIEDLFEGEKVWLNLPQYDSSILMSDEDGDKIFKALFYAEEGSLVEYYFSYQNGPDPEINRIEEHVDMACSDGMGHRNFLVYQADLVLPAIMFNACHKRPDYIQFHVDMNGIPDVYETGSVWINFPDSGNSEKMSDPDGDSIFSFLLATQSGTEHRFYYSYQNGADPLNDRYREELPGECSDVDGYRVETSMAELLELYVVQFGSCEEALPDGTDITDLTGSYCYGSNDDYPWEGADAGAGSPSAEQIEKLVDNDVLTKYLVRATNSWIEIVSPNLSKVHAYSITSANDAPDRDPRSWEFQGWNRETATWDVLHAVSDHNPWPKRFQRKSWYFENEGWYGKYRLHIKAINGNPNSLMQMAELQVFGETGEQISWSDDASLASLTTSIGSLHPEFDPSTHFYVLEFAADFSRVKIEAAPSDEEATVSGTGYIRLAPDVQNAVIRVRAADGRSTEDYTLDFQYLNINSGYTPDTEVLLYPNPCAGELTINLPRSRPGKVQVFSAQGIRIKDFAYDKDTFHLDLKELHAGLYFLKISSPDFWKYASFVMQ